MRNRTLHAALRDFALEVASTLGEALDAGGEVGYEVVEEPGSGPVLYRYRPLTTEFIDEHWSRLAALPAAARAARELGAGAATWLRSQGLTGADAEPALRAMVERLYEDATSFGFPEERFERLYGELERTLFDGTVPLVAVAPLRAAWIDSDRVELGPGIALVRGTGANAPREAAWPHPHLRDADEGPSVLIAIERDLPAGEDLPLDQVRNRIGDLVRALRLWGPGALAPAGSAWARADEGPWQHFDVDPVGPGRGEAWTLGPEEEGELREFIAAVERARVPGWIAWALERFESGCERPSAAAALTDFLMALRILLEGSDEAGRASLSLRLAALCAEEPERRAIQRRVELAFALERFLMNGGSVDAYVDEVGSDSPDLLTDEIERCVRALLRDVLCGYLDGDLRRTADDILLTSGAPVEIEARDMRADREPREPRTEASEPEPEPEPVTEEQTVLELAERDLETGEVPDGVTPSADWGFDDADCYSAPV